MKKLMAMMMAAIWISGCSSLHDGKGWEHTGDSSTHENDQPNILEHRH